MCGKCDHHKHDKKDPLVGTWNYQFQVAPNSDAIAYGNLNFFADGSIMGADSTGIGANSGLSFNTFQTPLTGQWKKIGHRKYKLFFVNVVINDQTRDVLGRPRFDGVLTLNHDKKSFVLDFTNSVGNVFDKDNICLTNPPVFPIPGLQTIGCKISF
jgi:hypothetical protein